MIQSFRAGMEDLMAPRSVMDLIEEHLFERRSDRFPDLSAGKSPPLSSAAIFMSIFRG